MLGLLLILRAFLLLRAPEDIAEYFRKNRDVGFGKNLEMLARNAVNRGFPEGLVLPI